MREKQKDMAENVATAPDPVEAPDECIERKFQCESTVESPKLLFCEEVALSVQSFVQGCTVAQFVYCVGRAHGSV